MKKSIRNIAITIPILFSAALSHASTVEINIYGSSSQYLFWNDAVDDFLLSRGCTNINQAQDSTKKHSITTSKACSSFGYNDVIIRYSTKASYEAARALKGISNPDSCPNAFQRKMADSIAAPNTLTCKTVTLGISDVAGESHVQESHGQRFGPMGGGNVDIVLTGEDISGLTAYNPLVVPFGFFVNKAVTARKCVATAPNFGSYCVSDADCGGTAGSCGAPSTIDNITRLQAVQIFGGMVSDWSDFGAYYTAQPIVACFRHAGSGAAAALDWSVMRGNGWGALLAQYEVPGWFWFNEGSTDLIKCVNGNNTATPTGSAIGTIGYADADQYTGVSGTSQNVKLVRYNGTWPSRHALRNGEYDFWTTQWVYEDTTRTMAAQRPVVDALISYASNPAYLPTTKAKYWATKDEMKFFKPGDGDFITFQGGAVNPQTP